MQDSRTFGRRAILGKLAATGIVGTGMAAQEDSSLVQSRERVSFKNFAGEKTPTTVLKKYGEPYANTASTVMGYDTFNTDVADAWFNGIFSISTTDPFNGNTTATDYSISVEPFLLPDDRYPPLINVVDPYVKNKDAGFEYTRLAILANTLASNAEAALPIVLPDLSGLSEDDGPSVVKRSYNNIRNRAFDVSWNEPLLNDKTALAVDFELDFQRAGDDGGAVSGTYGYDVTFETTIVNDSYERTEETITQRHQIFFDIEGGGGGGGGGDDCRVGEICIS